MAEVRTLPGVSREPVEQRPRRGPLPGSIPKLSARRDELVKSRSIRARLQRELAAAEELLPVLQDYIQAHRDALELRD